MHVLHTCTTTKMINPTKKHWGSVLCCLMWGYSLFCINLLSATTQFIQSAAVHVYNMYTTVSHRAVIDVAGVTVGSYCQCSERGSFDC